MKIYTKVTINIDTGKTVEEESFEYSGPIVLCQMLNLGGPGGGQNWEEILQQLLAGGGTRPSSGIAPPLPLPGRNLQKPPLGGISPGALSPLGDMGRGKQEIPFTGGQLAGPSPGAGPFPSPLGRGGLPSKTSMLDVEELSTPPPSYGGLLEDVLAKPQDPLSGLLAASTEKGIPLAAKADRVAPPEDKKPTTPGKTKDIMDSWEKMLQKLFKMITDMNEGKFNQTYRYSSPRQDKKWAEYKTAIAGGDISAQKPYEYEAVPGVYKDQLMNLITSIGPLRDYFLALKKGGGGGGGDFFKNILPVLISLGIGLCWVAREVYGNTNPVWLLFRTWLTTKAPKWFRNLYERHGERFAIWISDKPRIKWVIRKWMDSRINTLVRTRSRQCLG